MVGHGGIGVAPGTKWMACRICYDGATCFYGDFLACGQFMLCPTEPDGVSNPDCSKAPHVINNSWAIDPTDDGWGFDDVIEAWHAAGIIPVASVGNGNLCNQIGYPATKENMIGVGNSAMDNRASDSSSRGPAIDGSIKPDISAPGDYILSASSSADDVYILMSGTSMATPNTAGVIALLLSYKPDLTFNQVRQYLYDGASLNYRLTGQDCGNIVETRVPNNAFGHGIVDAFGSYQLLLADFPRVK